MRYLRSLYPVARRYTTASTASPEELKHFSQLAESWWDTQGPQRILHQMNSLRVDYLRDTLSKYAIRQPGYSADLLPKHAIEVSGNSMGENLKVLDVGCGGGILSESLARLRETSSVLGIDMSPSVIEVAKAHAKLDPALKGKLKYKLTELSTIKESYDLVTMFEMLEHVDQPAAMVRAALDRVRPGGWLFVSTINRTPISWFTTIFAAEDILKIVPKGTHTWSKYINQSEIRDWAVEQDDVEFVQSKGCIYVPTQGWLFTKDTSIGNYFMAIKKR